MPIIFPLFTDSICLAGMLKKIEDTNVLIQAPYAMQCFEDNHVVIPLVVVEELYGLKKRMVNAGSMPVKPSVF